MLDRRCKHVWHRVDRRSTRSLSDRTGIVVRFIGFGHPRLHGSIRPDRGTARASSQPATQSAERDQQLGTAEAANVRDEAFRLFRNSCSRGHRSTCATSKHLSFRTPPMATKRTSYHTVPGMLERLPTAEPRVRHVPRRTADGLAKIPSAGENSVNYVRV